MTRATHGDGGPRSPLTGDPSPRSPRYVPNRNGGDGDGGVTGTGGYGGWAYGVPVRTGVRDLKNGGPRKPRGSRVISPASRSSCALARLWCAMTARTHEGCAPS